jgi:hypothetical protein
MRILRIFSLNIIRGRLLTLSNITNTSTNFHKLLSFITRIWTGRVSKSEYFKYFLVVFSIYIIGIIVSAAVYPGGFSLLYVYVSYLGGYPNNPNGYIIYNTSVFITGFCLIPHFFYIYRQLQPNFKFFNVLSSFFGIIGCIAFAALGIFYQGSSWGPLGHQWATILAFGGFGVSAFFQLFIYLQKVYQRQSWPKLWHIILFYSLIFLILGIVLLFTESLEPAMFPEIDPAFFQDRFWEWFYLLIEIVWFFGMILITPSKTSTPKIN